MSTPQNPDPVRDGLAQIQEEMSDKEREILGHDITALAARFNAAEAKWDPNDPMHWLPREMAREVKEGEERKAAIRKWAKEWADAECRYVDNAINQLMFHHSRECQIQVNREVLGKKRKSISTPWGDVGHKTKPEHMKIVVDDEATALRHAKTSCPDAVKATSDSLLPSELAKHLKATGEMLPGTHEETTPASETFFIGDYKFGKPQTLTGPPQVPRISAGEFFNKTPNGKEQQ